MLEVLREDKTFKSFDIFDDEGQAPGSPVDYGLVLGFLHYLVGFFDEVAYRFRDLPQRRLHL